MSVRTTEQSWAVASSCKSHEHKCTLSQVDIQAEHDQWDTKQPVMSFRIFQTFPNLEAAESQGFRPCHKAKRRESGLPPAIFSCYAADNPLCCSGNPLPNEGWKGFIFLRVGTVMPGIKVSVISSL